MCGGIPLQLLDLLVVSGIVASRGILRHKHGHAVEVLFRHREISIHEEPRPIDSSQKGHAAVYDSTVIGLAPQPGISAGEPMM